MKYCFSYYTKYKFPEIKRRPWWNFFGMDSIQMVERTHRVVFLDLTKEEADVLSKKLTDSTCPESKIMKRLIGENATHLQLEIENPGTPYIKTEGTSE